MTTPDHTPTARPTPKPSSSDNPARPNARRVKFAAAVAALGAVALPHAASAQLPGRTAPAGCMAVEVQRGDTVSRIARANSLTLDQIAAINGHISNLNRVWPGDEIAVTCDPQGVALAAPQSVVRDVDVSQWLDEREKPNQLSWRAIIAHLYKQGLRGDDLITLSAISQCESNRYSTAVGDEHLVDKTWGPSYGPWQVRSQWKASGTFGARDIDMLRSGQVELQAWAAVEVWRQQGPKAWTCWRNGAHVGPMGAVRAAAAEMGL